MRETTSDADLAALPRKEGGALRTEGHSAGMAAQETVHTDFARSRGREWVALAGALRRRDAALGSSQWTVATLSANQSAYAPAAPPMSTTVVGAAGAHR